jgi:hypothetical protein
MSLVVISYAGIVVADDAASATEDDDNTGKLTMMNTNNGVIISKFLIVQTLEGGTKTILFLLFITFRL